MKKLNITKKQYDESKYFNKKYGSLKFVSESGKLYKTDKGVVIALEGTNNEVKKESIEDIIDDRKDDSDEETIKKEKVVSALKDVVDVIKGIAKDAEIEVPGLVLDDEDDDDDKDDDDVEITDECGDKPVKEGCDCTDGKCKCESTKAKKSRIIREAIAKKIRARKMMEARKARLAKIAESRKAKAAESRKQKILESIRRRRAAKKVMESLKEEK